MISKQNTYSDFTGDYHKRRKKTYQLNHATYTTGSTPLCRWKFIQHWTEHFLDSLPLCNNNNKFSRKFAKRRSYYRCNVVYISLSLLGYCTFLLYQIYSIYKHQPDFLRLFPKQSTYYYIHHPLNHQHPNSDHQIIQQTNTTTNTATPIGYTRLSSSSSSFRGPSRSTTSNAKGEDTHRKSVRRFPAVVIENVTFHRAASIRAPVVAKRPRNIALSSDTTPDYGGINRNRNGGAPKVDQNNDIIQQHLYHDSLLEVFDNGIIANEWYDFHDYDKNYAEGTTSSKDCVRPIWYYTYYPNCMNFHDTYDSTIQRAKINPYKSNAKYLAQGFFRETWSFQEPSFESFNATIKTATRTGRDIVGESYVVKHLRYIHDYTIENIARIRLEAFLLQEHTGNPAFTKIYGHCGTSTMMEKANEISKLIVPPRNDNIGTVERGKIKQGTLDEIERHNNGQPYPLNNLTLDEKVKFAIGIAEGVASLHGYKGGPIIHEDVHVDQWLISNDGNIILSDINTAEILDYNFDTNTSCTYFTQFDGPFRSPEEAIGSYVDESADLWPMGNIIFSLLTGLFPYYHIIYDLHRIEKMVQQGIPPYINPLYATRSFVEGELFQIMNQCYKVDPTERITIFEVVQRLKEIHNTMNGKEFGS